MYGFYIELEVSGLKGDFDPLKPRNADEPGAGTVGECADNAEQVLRGFTDAKHEPNVESCYGSDVITNLLHLCDKKGWDAEDMLTSAVSTWFQERKQ